MCIGSGVEEHSQYLGFVPLSSFDHDRFAIRGVGVGIGAGVQQYPHYFRVAKLDGCLQDRTALFVPEIGVGTGPK